jgi:hypothetical protein
MVGWASPAERNNHAVSTIKANFESYSRIAKACDAMTCGTEAFRRRCAIEAKGKPTTQAVAAAIGRTLA